MQICLFLSFGIYKQPSIHLQKTNRGQLDVYKRQVYYIEKPTVAEIKEADVVLLSMGTRDKEAVERPFEMCIRDSYRGLERCCFYRYLWFQSSQWYYSCQD